MAEDTFDFTDLNKAVYIPNLAEYMDDDQLDEIGAEQVKEAEQDRDSRKELMESIKDWLKLATQVKEDKTFPWPGASNVKFPLLTIASMQFHARALPSLLPDDRPVKAKVLGKRTPDQSKVERGDRVSEYMSYQLLDEQPEWVDEMDRLLFILPMVGLCYKKTYYSSKYKRNKSELILPNEMYINYYAKNFEDANKTHAIPMEGNELLSLQRKGIYLDVNLGDPQQPKEKDPNAKESVSETRAPSNAYDLPYTLYERECWLDLDGDGYKEPYFVTVDSMSGKVLRIVARWKVDGVSYNEEGEVIEIADITQVTPFIFLPDPSSATSGLGLGSLLGAVNDAVNTIVNQLIDGGTLSNLQGGFLAKGAKLRGGATSFRPGEWKIVNSTGDDLKKSIVPLPANQPSQVLFSLLGMLAESGEKIGSITDMMTGQNPGQNQKATTSMAVLEQGMKVFSSIYKRVYRAFSKELAKCYQLNSDFLSDEKYNNFLDGEEQYSTKEDFNTEDLNVIPAADPSVISDTQKVYKSQALLEKIPLGTVNPVVATRRALIAEGQEDVDEIMNIPERPPSIEEREMDLKEKIEPMRLRIDALTAKMKALELQTKSGLNEATTAKTLSDVEISERKQALEEARALVDTITQSIELSEKKKEPSPKQE